MRSEKKMFNIDSAVFTTSFSLRSNRLFQGDFNYTAINQCLPKMQTLDVLCFEISLLFERNNNLWDVYICLRSTQNILSTNVPIFFEDTNKVLF